MLDSEKEDYVNHLLDNPGTVNLREAAEACKLGFQEQVVPALRDDPKFLQQIIQHLEGVKYSLFQLVHDHATAKTKKKISLPAIKFLIDAINDRSVLGEEFKSPQAKGPASAAEKRQAGLMNQHRAALGLKEEEQEDEG